MDDPRSFGSKKEPVGEYNSPWSNALLDLRELREVLEIRRLWRGEVDVGVWTEVLEVRRLWVGDGGIIVSHRIFWIIVAKHYPRACSLWEQ